MDNIKVLENFLDQEYQDELERLIGDEYFPLYMRTHTVVYADKHSPYYWEDKSTQEGIVFCHAFLKDNNEVSTYYEAVDRLATIFLITTGLALFPRRIRFNLTTTDANYGGDKHYTPHIDTDYEGGCTAIYYVNDSDGDTLFFKTPDEKDKTKDLEVIKRLTPKKGTLVYFPRDTIHAGQPPVNTPCRAVINLNFAP